MDYIFASVVYICKFCKLANGSKSISYLSGEMSVGFHTHG